MSILANISNIFGRAFAGDPPAGHIERDEDFVDVHLSILEQRWDKRGVLTLVARASIDGITVGFAIDIQPDWRPKLIDDTAITVYWGSGCIRRIGADSDRFVKLLAREFGLPDKGPMSPRVEVTLAGLGNDPREIRTMPANIKIFFETGGPESYGEAFIVVDLARQTLEFRDKDPEYHPGLLSALAGNV